MLESQGKGSTFAKVLKDVLTLFVIMIHVQANCLFGMELNERQMFFVGDFVFSYLSESLDWYPTH